MRHPNTTHAACGGAAAILIALLSACQTSPESAQTEAREAQAKADEAIAQAQSKADEKTAQAQVKADEARVSADEKAAKAQANADEKIAKAQAKADEAQATADDTLRDARDALRVKVERDLDKISAKENEIEGRSARASERVRAEVTATLHDADARRADLKRDLANLDTVTADQFTAVKDAINARLDELDKMLSDAKSKL